MASVDNATENLSVQGSVSYNSSDPASGVVPSDSQSVHTTVTHGTQGTIKSNASLPSSPTRSTTTPSSMSPASTSMQQKNQDVVGTMEPMPKFPHPPQQQQQPRQRLAHNLQPPHGDILLGMQRLELQAQQQQQLRQQPQQGLHHTYPASRERSNPVSDDDQTEPSSSANTGDNNNAVPNATGYTRSDTGATSTFGKMIKSATRTIQSRNNSARKDSQDEEGVIEGALIYGYLQKLGRNGRWQTRWFETDGECLTYYKSSKRNKLLATLDLAKVGSIVIDHEDATECCFIINISERPYHLRADSSSACKDWVITLNRVKEARMHEGNVKLLTPGDQPPDLLDTFTPRVVVVANRQRTHAVEDDDFHNWEAMDDNRMPNKYTVAPTTSARLARWQKPKTSIARIASKVLAWARSIRKYRCQDADNHVVLDHHLHPPGHDDKVKRVHAVGAGAGSTGGSYPRSANSGQPHSAAASVSTDHSPTGWIQDQNSTDKSFPREVTTTDLLDADTMTPGQSPVTDNADDDDDEEARFLS